MSKSLNDILKRYSDALSGKRSSTVNTLTTGDNPGVDYADKMKDTRDFIAQHSVERFDDRVGNGDDVYKASNVKKAAMERHGHEPKPKDIKVYKKNQQVGQPENVKEEAEITEKKDEREYGYEGDMATTQLKTICRHAEHLMKMLKPDTDLPEWVQSKITKAEDYIATAHDYLMSEMNEAKMCESCGKTPCSCDATEPKDNGKDKAGKRKLLTDKKIQEMATSQAQQKLMAMAYRYKQNSNSMPDASDQVKKLASSMSKKQLRDFAATKHEGLPKKVEEAIHHSTRQPSADIARNKMTDGIIKRSVAKIKKEQAAPAETAITMPSGAVGDTGRV